MDYINVFKKSEMNINESGIFDEAMMCMHQFSDFFSQEDLEGMDSCLHFPHYIISGAEVICWENPGRLTSTFFEELKRQGFKKTRVDYIEPILVLTDKVHIKYGYSRMNTKDEVMSQHDNVWILTKKDGIWGIQVRSY